MSALVEAEGREQLCRTDQLLLWNIRQIVAVGRVILPEQLALLFGAIYGAVTTHPLLSRAREEVFRLFPEQKERADRVCGELKVLAGV